MNTLGKYIAGRRMAKKLSIRKLAELAHISHTEIYRIENGERKHPSPLVLKAIAIALDLCYQDILKAAGYVEDNSLVSNPLGGVDDLNEGELKEVRDFIEFLRNKRLKNETK
jgi:transcriptional regulator with XRE-family HTH domain